jgi:hypothetical protein
MRTSPPTLAALALVALLGCADPTSPSRPPPPPPSPSLSADLSVRSDAGEAGPFSLAALGSLAVEARLAGAEPGAHPARIDVLTPRGTLYAQLAGTVEVGADGTGRLARVLEVRGTPIEAFRQVGGWRLVLTVGGGEPLATAEVGLAE